MDCVCELAACYFAKRRALGCNCRKRKHGQPRRASGFSCKIGLRDRIYAERAQWRQWWPGAAAARFDPAEEPSPPMCR